MNKKYIPAYIYAKKYGYPLQNIYRWIRERKIKEENIKKEKVIKERIRILDEDISFETKKKRLTVIKNEK